MSHGLQPAWLRLPEVADWLRPGSGHPTGHDVRDTHMPLLLISLGLTGVAGLIALSRGRRPLGGAWPAYIFALPLGARSWNLIQTLTGARSESVHEAALVLQQLVTIAFLGLLVVPFAARWPVTGPHGTWSQGLVALLGTFILYLVGFLPVEPSTATTSLLASSAVLLGDAIRNLEPGHAGRLLRHAARGARSRAARPVRPRSPPGLSR
jgi:hypothetical protein